MSIEITCYRSGTNIIPHYWPGKFKPTNNINPHTWHQINSQIHARPPHPVAFLFQSGTPLDTRMSSGWPLTPNKTQLQSHFDHRMHTVQPINVVMVSIQFWILPMHVCGHVSACIGWCAIVRSTGFRSGWKRCVVKKHAGWIVCAC